MADFDFRFGASVTCSEGRLVGSLERLIVEHDGLDPHSVVVKEDDGFAGRRLAPGSWYFHDELIVPIEAVARAGRDGVELKLNAAEARQLRPYLSYRYRPTDLAQVGRTVIALASGGPSTPNMDEIAHKSASELEVAADENVMLGHGGRKLGEVRDVLIEDSEFIGIVVRPTGLFVKDVVIPVRFLERSDDMALFVDLSEEDLQRLRPADS